MDQRICKAFIGYKRLWSDTGSLSKPNPLDQALELNRRDQGNDAKCISFLSATSAIIEIAFKINAFTPHWMEWNCLIYKDRYSTGSYHVLFVTHVVKETKATQSLLCIVFCLLHPHYFQLRHRRHSLKSHRSPLHPVCQQTSQRTDNSLPARYSSFSASCSSSSFHAVPTRDFNAAGQRDGA